MKSFGVKIGGRILARPKSLKHKLRFGVDLRRIFDDLISR